MSTPRPSILTPLGKLVALLVISILVSVLWMAFGVGR